MQQVHTPITQEHALADRHVVLGVRPAATGAPAAKRFGVIAVCDRRSHDPSVTTFGRAVNRRVGNEKALSLVTSRRDDHAMNAAELLAVGVRPDVVTERLGHRSVALTLQQYAHCWTGDQRSALARFRDARAALV